MIYLTFNHIDFLILLLNVYKDYIYYQLTYDKTFDTFNQIIFYYLFKKVSKAFVHSGILKPVFIAFSRFITECLGLYAF